MVGDVLTCSAVIGPSARSESRWAIFSAVSSSSSGSAVKMPPGDLPVTIAHVANVTRSDASRGGTSEFSASATACWFSAVAAVARSGCSRGGPCGLSGGGGGGGVAGGASSPASSACAPAGLPPPAAVPISSAVCVCWYSCSCCDLVAVLDRVLDQLLDGVQVRVPDRLQLDRRQVEVVLDAVLDPHRHQRVEAELDQRHLPGQVLGLVAHRAGHDRRQSLPDRLTRIRRPLLEAGAEVGALGQVVVQDLGVAVVPRRPVRRLAPRRPDGRAVPTATAAGAPPDLSGSRPRRRRA